MPRRIDVCDTIGERVRRGDPDRYLSTTASGLNQDRLLTLYAFNIEVMRATWVVSSESLGLMRLHWWSEAIDEIYACRRLRKHDVVQALDQTSVAATLPKPMLSSLIEASSLTIGGLRIDDESRLDRFLNSGPCELMWAAALLLGADADCKSAVRSFAWGAGVASLLRAEPALKARERSFVGNRSDLVPELARRARDRIGIGRTMRRRIPPAVVPAMLAGWRADHALSLALRSPDKVVEGRLAESEIRRRGTLIWRTFTGRW